MGNRRSAKRRRVLTFRKRRPPAGFVEETVDPENAQVGVRLPDGTKFDIPAILADARTVADGALADPKPHLMPNAELRQAVETLMRTLLKHREEFNQFDPSGRLRRLYERFRCALEETGFRV